jgi:membrane-associated phospholipid phosphatase
VAVFEGAYTAPALRSSSALRTLALGAVAVGFAAPLVRRRLKLRPAVVSLLSWQAPVALAVARPRSAWRDAGIYFLQMWAYLAHYEMPNDDPDKLLARLRIDYPIRADTALGLGTAPTVRLQRALGRPGEVLPHDLVLAWIYWTLPTAPPWWAAQNGNMPQVRRMMVEVGEHFWGRAWRPLYDFLGGNPFAAMPSLHFATSVMAAHVLSDVGRVPGALGWSYAAALGFALVYLGEHYVVDLAAGLALAEGVRRLAPVAEPLVDAVARRVQLLEPRTS